MTSANALIGNTKDNNDRYCFAKAGELCLISLPTGGSTDLDLSDAHGSFTVKSFNPRAVGKLTNGSVTSAEGGKSSPLGNAPGDVDQDWLFVARP